MEAGRIDSSWFSPDELLSFSRFLTGEAEVDQRNFRTLLATVAELLGETDDDKLIEKLVDQTIATTGAERGLLLTADAGADGGFAVRIARDAQGSDLGPRPPLCRTVPELVLREARPVIERVGGNHEVLALSHSIAAMRLRQVMCAPLRARGRLIGAIYVDSTLSGPPHTDADLMLFHAQAGCMSMAMENQRLFRQALRNREVENELRVARDIQRRLLPDAVARLGDVELAGHSEPTHRVGGDYFDYFELSEGRIGLCIADVSGHGVGPALIMSNVRAHLRSLLLMRRTLAGLYGMLNRALCAELTDGMFVSLFVGAFDPQERRLEFQNAGHPPPLLYDRGKDEFREIGTTAPALGIMDERSAGPCPSVRVPAGAVLTCFTDGLTESHDRAGNLYGEDRVRERVREAVRADAAPSTIIHELRADLTTHTEGLPPRDDVTLLVARF